MADIKQIAVIVGIAVIFTAFIIIATETFYESPRYENYCNGTAYYGPYYPEKTTPERQYNSSCPVVDYYTNSEVKNCVDKKGTPEFNYTKDNCPVFNNCNYCSKYFDDATKKHGNISFIILAIIALAAILFGVFFKIEFIGSGFMYAGIFILFYATMRFLSLPEQNKYLKVIILFVELLILLLIGYKKLYKKKQEK